MRLTGSNSPDRMLTDQFDSRSESTRTLHSLPSQVAVAMARVVPEARASMVETARRERARELQPERLLERNCRSRSSARQFGTARTAPAGGATFRAMRGACDWIQITATSPTIIIRSVM